MKISFGMPLAFTLSIFISTLSIATFAESNNYPTFDELVKMENSEEAARQDFQQLVEQNLVWRSKTINFQNEIKDKINSDTPINSEQKIRMENGIFAYSALRDDSLSSIEEIKWLFNRQSTIDLTDDRTSISEDVRSHSSRIGETYINLKESIGLTKVLEIKRNLALATLLYDGYLLAIAPFQNSSKRNLINEDSTIPNQLEKVARNFFKYSNLATFKRAVIFFKKSLKKEAELNINNEENNYLNALITKSFVYNQNIDYLELFIGNRIVKWSMIADFFKTKGDNLMNELSKSFGNSVGLIQSRHGKLLSMTEGEQEEITSQLRPLDILFEKTPFRLTDKFIPGHWGHVAIWVGSEEELQELGVWELLPVWEREARSRKSSPYTGESFQSLIKKGHRIVEALRPGVSINTLHHFLEIDDMAAIRPNNLTDSERENYLRLAFLQLGKEYDFNFNIETEEKIVCSEIVYRVFVDKKYNWPTTKAVGRYTISPDEVAKLGLKNGEEETLFSTVLIYHDGKRLPAEYNEENFKLLFETKYDQIKY